MKLTYNQNKIVTAPEERVIIIAAAASGKTECLTQRVKYLLDHKANPDRMVVITFTNAAAEEMSNRIGIDGAGMFIGTIHSYANNLLLKHNIDTFGKIEEEDFDGLFQLIQENPECIESVDYLLLDEAQDLNEKQFQFIFDIINPVGFFVVGDYRQAIYRFCGGRPDLFCGLTTRENVKTYELNENFRNGQSILNYADWILRNKASFYSDDIFYFDNSICRSNREGHQERFDYNERKIIELIQNDNHYNDWFILARTNQVVNKMIKLLKENNIPCDTFRKAELTRKQLHDKAMDNTVKVLTAHTAKGLEAKNVIVIDLKMYNEEESILAYVAATRAKENLYMITGDHERSKPKGKSKVKNWE